MLVHVMSVNFLQWAEPFSEEEPYDKLNDVPSDPARADNLTDFTGAIWNQYGGEYDPSDIGKLTSFFSDNCDDLDTGELRGYLTEFEKANGNPDFLEDY